MCSPRSHFAELITDQTRFRKRFPTVQHQRSLFARPVRAFFLVFERNVRKIRPAGVRRTSAAAGGNGEEEKARKNNYFAKKYFSHIYSMSELDWSGWVVGGRQQSLQVPIVAFSRFARSLAERQIIFLIFSFNLFAKLQGKPPSERARQTPDTHENE
jgi:hypothetical protein